MGNHVVVVKHRENPKFLTYMFSSKYCRQQIEKYAKGSTVQDLKLSDIKKIKIPLPSLEKQNEIVHLLDQMKVNLLDLETHIKGLINLREKQYNFNSEKILSK